jgi:hypothetical protein
MPFPQTTLISVKQQATKGETMGSFVGIRKKQRI